MQATIQQKQKYLRDHIDSNKYEQFYEFCEMTSGNINIQAWSIGYIQELVYKFNVYQLQLKNNKAKTKKDHETSYAQYQTNPNQQQYNENTDNVLQALQQTNSNYQSSKVEKSAVDLLDNVFDESAFKSTSGQNNQMTNSNSFQDFDFWTSNIKPDDRSQVRKKSMTQFNSNLDQKTSRRNYTQTPYVRQSTQIQPVYSPPEYDLGLSEVYVPPKKQSPYQKKQAPYEVEVREKKKETTVKKVDGKSVQPEEVAKEHLKKWLVEEVGFKEKLSCFKSTIRKNFANPNLNVIIDSHDIVERSFLASNYTMFHIKVVPDNIVIKRNFEDFSKLRDNLMKFFPGHHIPYLQPNSWFSGTSIQFIKDQKKMLQFFLRDLIRNKQMVNSRVFQDFLTLKDHKSIKRKFQKYDDIEKPKGIEELCLIDGKVEVAINKEQNNYKQNLKRYIQKMDDLLYKHQKLCEQLQEQYYEISQTLNSVINLMTELQKQTKNFNSKVNINEVKYLSSVFRVVKQSYKESQSCAKFQYELSKRKISPFVKYQRSNILQLNTLIDLDSKLTKSYDKRIEREKVEHDDIYNSEKAKDGKRGISEESRNIIVLKYQTGFFNKQVCKQGQRVFDQLGLKFLQRWQKIGQSYLDKTIKSTQYWKDLTKLERQKFMPTQYISA